MNESLKGWGSAGLDALACVVLGSASFLAVEALMPSSADAAPLVFKGVATTTCKHLRENGSLDKAISHSVELWMPELREWAEEVGDDGTLVAQYAAKETSELCTDEFVNGYKRDKGEI